MEVTASLNELIALGTALVAAGAVAGLLAGTFGIGGGIVLVPVMVEFLAILGVDEAVRVHLAVGTSLGIIVPTSIRSYLSHRKRGTPDTDLLKFWILPILSGVAAASLLAAFISGDGLSAIFGIMAFFMGIRMIFNREGWRLGDDIPKGAVGRVVGFLIGFFSTLMGIGGGVLNTTFMTLYGRPMHQAVGTSAGTGVLISIPAIFGMMLAGWNAQGLPPFSIGYVNLLGVLLVIPVTILMAPLGVRLAHAMSRRALEIAFGLFLFGAAVRFVGRLF